MASDRSALRCLRAIQVFSYVAVTVAIASVVLAVVSLVGGNLSGAVMIVAMALLVGAVGMWGIRAVADSSAKNAAYVREMGLIAVLLTVVITGFNLLDGSFALTEPRGIALLVIGALSVLSCLGISLAARVLYRVRSAE